MCLLFSGQTLKLSAVNSSFFYYKQLGIKEGLSQSKVQAILNDHRGYLWIGTESGLNRYDSNHLKQYLHQQGDSTSLPSNEILFIAEDSLYNLWVATKAGMCLYDRGNDCFKKVVINGNRNSYANSYLLLNDGIIFGGMSCIYKFEYNTKKWNTYFFKQLPNAHIPFRKMVYYDNNTILMNTQWNGIYSFNMKTKQLKRIEDFAADNYSAIYVDKKNHLWISPYRKGLYCYKNGKPLKHFTSENSSLTYNVIHDITEKENQLWIATDGGGINILSLDDFSFSHINKMQDDVNSFPASAIYRIYCDPANNIWAGSVHHGLIGIKRTYAHSYQNVPFNNSFGLSEQPIHAFFQDSDGILWIGTDGGGINRFEPASGTFKHYSTTKHEKITSIVDFTPHELLFFSFDKGFCLFDKRNGQVRPFSAVDEEANNQMYVSGITAYLMRLPNNKILISSKQVYIYDITTKRLEQITNNERKFQRYAPLIVGVKDAKVYLSDWRRIYEYNLNTKQLSVVYKGEQIINDACIDRNGLFWLASANGLISHDPITQNTRTIPTNLFDETTSVISDNQHRIWIGTRRNLYIYSTTEDKVIILNETDGISPNEYLSCAHLLLQNGDIVLGGINGMTYLNSKIHFVPENEYKIELLDILLNGRSVSLKESGTKLKTINIPWNFSSLQLKVLLNSGNIFTQNIFQFKIKENDEQLPYSESNSLIINYLPVGEYTITSSYYARNGEWSQEQEILHVVVTPPWWKTTVFYIVMGILLCTILYSIMYIIYRKKKMKQRQEIVRLKSKMYEEKIDFLTNISHELRTPLTLICAPLKRMIHHEIDKEKTESQLISIYKQARHMKNIIDMVLDVRKLEEKKDMLRILPHPLNEWIHKIGEKFITEFEAKNIDLTYELDNTIQEIPFDNNKCEFVLSNFLMNALKFSEEGTITTIRTSLSPDNKWVRVSVVDQGMGLSMIETDSLFSSFYQGHHNKGGTGIGLAYAKNLIAFHQGRIGAINNQEQGATFYFDLPVNSGKPSTNLYTSNIETSNEETEIKETIISDYSFLKDFTVVIVEDIMELRNYLKETLSGYFAKVYVAKDGKEGLELIKQKQPDIIVSDVMMPKMNGFELCRTVKTGLEISHIPFILLTAYHNPQNMYTGYKTGADAFLPKPFEIDGLLSLIYNQLKLRESIKVRYANENALNLQEVNFSNADETFLMKFNNLILEHISDSELNVSFLASNMCISRSLLFNKIKALTGMGIIDYMNKIRIERASFLLTTTSMTLTEISELAGFSSLRYFRQVFKVHKNMTPSEYKKQMTNE
ncbi:two-component regulator propeller domain-containing protein [uncultured Bacteroides sp.]|uniref:hybrid sensor histidine kinase/response regulator transcription factor n=1 Tax=uncultured Bacteroides sp. TaxID=162156 RepID=UPI00258BD194|nr:two-component regulator propeller domain-containing protein [uncultured Bacteroides sp.]